MKIGLRDGWFGSFFQSFGAAFRHIRRFSVPLRVSAITRATPKAATPQKESMSTEKTFLPSAESQRFPAIRGFLAAVVIAALAFLPVLVRG